jgi:hypothetical protein
MAKQTLHLSIDNNLVDIAKSMNINLSAEFEQWIRIRLNQNDIIDDKNDIIIDKDKEIAVHMSEIKKLQSQKELQKEVEERKSEESMIIDQQIDNMKLFNEDLTNPSIERIHGMQFLFRKKFNKELNSLQSKDLLLNRIKERGL